MARFNVPITRDCTETTVVDVEAENAEQARDIALGEATRHPNDFDWVPDDGSGFEDPYFAGDDDLEAIEEIQ